MFTRFQGLVLAGGSGFFIWMVATNPDMIAFRGGNVLGYIVSGTAVLVGLAMLITGENPLKRS